VRSKLREKSTCQLSTGPISVRDWTEHHERANTRSG